MSLLLLVSLVPMVLFVLVDYFTRSLRAGIITAVVTAAAMGGLMWWLMGEFDYEVIVIVATMLITGLISIKFKTPVFFKLQPVITGLILAAVLAYFQYFDTPLMVKMLPKLRTMIENIDSSLPAEQLDMLLDDSRIPFFTRLTQYMIIWLLAHAALVAVCALKTTNTIWLLAKAIGLPFVVIGSLLTEWLYQWFA